MNPKRKQIEKLILDTVLTMEPGGLNHTRYKKRFDAMSDKDFDKFMSELKSGKRKLSFFAPNMKVVLKQEDLIKAADKIGAEVFTRITYDDPVTGITYTTPQKCLCILAPVRRTRQFLHHGLSVPEGDSRIDVLSGQVMKPDQASKFSFVETQLLLGRGMDDVIREFIKIRGGDISAYANYKQQLEETGEFSQESLDPNTVPRSAMISHLVLLCMGLDNNLVETSDG